MSSTPCIEPKIQAGVQERTKVLKKSVPGRIEKVEALLGTSKSKYLAEDTVR
jgi:hypothetical protein